jgi:hypothetical protein
VNGATLTSARPRSNAVGTRLRGAVEALGGSDMELVIGLGFMALIWIVVIYGSNYVNKNVQ